MDVYLPSDFRELHAAAPDDWRDLSTSWPASADDRDGATAVATRMDRSDPDPLWHAL